MSLVRLPTPGASLSSGPSDLLITGEPNKPISPSCPPSLPGIGPWTHCTSPPLQPQTTPRHSVVLASASFCNLTPVCRQKFATGSICTSASTIIWRFRKKLVVSGFILSCILHLLVIYKFWFGFGLKLMKKTHKSIISFIVTFSHFYKTRIQNTKLSNFWKVSWRTNGAQTALWASPTGKRNQHLCKACEQMKHKIMQYLYCLNFNLLKLQMK